MVDIPSWSEAEAASAAKHGLSQDWQSRTNFVDGIFSFCAGYQEFVHVAIQRLIVGLQLHMENNGRLTFSHQHFEIEDMKTQGDFGMKKRTLGPA